MPTAQFADMQNSLRIELGSDPKNSGVAVLLSFFWSGLGQIYNGQILKGILMMGAHLIAWFLCLVFIGFILVPIIWVFGMYDAYNTAERINSQARRRRGIAMV